MTHTQASTSARFADFASGLRRLPIARRCLTALRSRELDPADRLLVSYPKSGSTWVRFAVAYALGAEPDYDRIGQLVPPLGRREHVDAVRTLDGGRVIRSHEPASRLRARRRTLVVVRDGRDVAVSSYYHARRQGTFEGDFGSFLPVFLTAGFFVYGTWHAHTSGWIDAARSKRRDVLLVRYEDVLRDPAAEFERMFQFVGIPCGGELHKVLEAASPANMREKAARSEKFGVAAGDDAISLVRSATSGDWRNYFSRAQLESFYSVAGSVLHELGYSTDSHE